MPPPRISVIVPVHRDAGALAVALRSILGQTRDDFEAIVSGDGADAAVERAALSTGDPRVRWIGFPKEPGYGYSNRGRAIARARGDRIAYLAPDDLWAPDHLERLVGLLEREACDVVFSRPILVWPGGTARPHFLPFAWARGGVAPPVTLLGSLSPTQVIHTKEIHDRAGGWDDAYARHGDVDLWLRMRSSGARIRYLAEATSIRFPGYAFRGRAARQRELQRAYAERLAAGTLRLSELRWKWPRRIAGWGEDIAVVGAAKGPGWLRALFARRRRARVTRRGGGIQS